MNERIKAVRESAGLNRSQFAKRIGTTLASVSYYESGSRNPSNAVLLSISREFHVSLHWLQTGEGPMEDPDPADDTPARLIETYQNLPKRFQDAVQVLMKMDPEWWKVLDDAFAAWEATQKKEGADD